MHSDPDAMITPYKIGFMLFPDVTQLDLTGPAQVLSRMPGVVVHLAAKSLEPVPTDSGFAILPTTTLEDCPVLDMVCVPGGGGTTAVMEDEVQLAWLRERASRASLVTSVCTGSLILGAAGLLRGYRAACYWAFRDALRLFGAEPVAERVVIDRNRITGGGVTAGIDFGFHVIAHVHGRDMAEEIRLALEYDPQPLGAGGTPETARPEILARVRERMLARGGAERAAAIARIASQGG